MQRPKPSHVAGRLQAVRDALQEVTASPRVFDMLIFVRGLISRSVRAPHAGLRAHRRLPGLHNPVSTAHDETQYDADGFSERGEERVSAV